MTNIVNWIVPVELEQLKASHAVAMDILNKIAAMPRKTKEQRLASSCVTFLDSLDKA